MNVQEQKIKQLIKKLERDVENQKKHIRFLNQKLLREHKSKDALSNLLKELHAEKLLDKKKLKNLEVSFFSASIHIELMHKYFQCRLQL